MLEKEEARLPTPSSTSTVWKSTGAKHAGVVDRAKGTRKERKEVISGDRSLYHHETWGLRLSHFPSFLSITVMGTSDNVAGKKHKIKPTFVTEPAYLVEKGV